MHSSRLRFDKALAQVTLVKLHIIEELADEVVKFAQADAPVDTGYYRDHIYSIPPGGSGKRNYTQFLVNRHGRRVKRSSITVGVNSAETAAVVASATYAIHVERRYHVLANAAMNAAQIAAEVVGRNRV